MEWLVETSDGRTLAVEDAGDLDGRPVLVHVGTPGGRRLYSPRTLADAERRQLRLISYDRPGYGGSTPQPGRCMADCAGDVRAICAALGTVPFGHGQWLAERIPGVEAWFFEEEGHGLPKGHIGDVHAWLVDRSSWPAM